MGDAVGVGVGEAVGEAVGVGDAVGVGVGEGVGVGVGVEELSVMATTRRLALPAVANAEGSERVMPIVLAAAGPESVSARQVGEVSTAVEVAVAVAVDVAVDVPPVAVDVAVEVAVLVAVAVMDGRAATAAPAYWPEALPWLPNMT